MVFSISENNVVTVEFGTDTIQTALTFEYYPHLTFKENIEYFIEHALLNREDSNIELFGDTAYYKIIFDYKKDTNTLTMTYNSKYGYACNKFVMDLSYEVCEELYFLLSNFKTQFED